MYQWDRVPCIKDDDYSSPRYLWSILRKKKLDGNAGTNYQTFQSSRNSVAGPASPAHNLCI